MNLTDHEHHAIALKEAETELLRQKAELAFVYCENDAARTLAHLWGVKTPTINTLARVYYEIGIDYIWPHVPLSLYRAALDTDAPLTWLLRAIDEEWSARQLRDAADVAKGRRVSSVPWLSGEAGVAEVIEQRAGDGVAVLLLLDEKPSGETPNRVRVRAVEVLNV